MKIAPMSAKDRYIAWCCEKASRQEQLAKIKERYASVPQTEDVLNTVAYYEGSVKRAERQVYLAQEDMLKGRAPLGTTTFGAQAQC